MTKLKPTTSHLNLDSISLVDKMLSTQRNTLSIVVYMQDACRLPYADNDFCVWVLSGIAEHNLKALFTYECVLEDTREERYSINGGCLDVPVQSTLVQGYVARPHSFRIL